MTTLIAECFICQLMSALLYHIKLYTILPHMYILFLTHHCTVAAYQALDFQLELQKATPGIHTVISSGITKCVHHSVCETDADKHVF